MEVSSATTQDRRPVALRMARHSAALLVLGLFCVRGGLGQEVLLGDNGPSSAALSFNPATDPLADVDTYKLLTQADIEGQWSQDDGRNVTEKMKELMSFGSITHVDVKLVGFDGDGNYDLKVDEADFLRYFETVLEEHEKEAMVVNAKKGKSHILPIRKRFFFRVIKAKASINEDITNRIRSWIVTKNSNDIDEAIRSGSRVPVNLVDEVIRKDYLSGDLSQTHTIYLLNPKRVVVKDSPAADADPGAGGGGGDPKEKRNPVTPPFPSTTLAVVAHCAAFHRCSRRATMEGSKTPHGWTTSTRTAMMSRL